VYFFEGGEGAAEVSSGVVGEVGVWGVVAFMEGDVGVVVTRDVA
jgi:hypothetical protein